MNIGLYGGSFNPVHNGHVAVVKEVLKRNIVDEIWVVPCKNHALKKDLAPVADRLKMLEYAFKNINNVRIDLTEINSNKINYTSETLEEFKKNYSHNFYLIAGSDAFNDLNMWHNSSYIKNNAGFIGINREGYVLDYDIKKILNILIDPVMSLSSTDIRERVKRNESISGLVNSEVEKYIITNRLYFNNNTFRNPASTVDIIISDEKGTILIKRKHDPFKGFWALPGGYLDYGMETLEGAAVRELREETSLIADANDLELIGVYSDPKRDPRGHVISHAYAVKKYSGIPFAADDAAEIGVFKILPNNLAFDHAKILSDYRAYLIRNNEQKLLDILYSKK
ncbi:MAG: nicotinate (nicotinamide) nucleotide adenylyltransferase [Candidatus Woesearchaeota archaeon]